MGWFQDQLKGAAESAFGSNYLRDYTHASKTFRPDMYKNAPKFKFLFHTVFNVNPDILKKTDLPPNFGVLVRDAKLPAFTFNTHTMNQYNRKRIVQTKIKYDPVQITFHDDNGDTINKLWVAYYSYYYADGGKPKVEFGGARGSFNPESRVTLDEVANYNQRTIYDPAIANSNDWGYIGEPPNTTSTTASKVKAPFFNNITIFGFHNHSFTAYTLVNPMITSFAHDTYSYDEGGGVMKNSMTVDYETVVYNEGEISGNSPDNIVTGFGDRTTYDTALSPIAKPGSNATFLGQGGLVNTVGGSISKILSGQGSLSDVLNAGRAYNTFKNMNVKETMKAELTGMLSNAINNVPNSRNALFDFPARSTSPGPSGLAGSSPVDATVSPVPVEEPGSIIISPTPGNGLIG